MDNCLGKLLSPVPEGVFLEKFRERRHFHIDRGRAGFYDAILSVADLDRHLQSELLPAAFLNVVENGRPRPMEDWSRSRTFPRGQSVVAVPERLFSLYREGATLILNSCDEVIPPLARACRILARELGYPVQANVYITPPQAQGFGRHRDLHEVLILQIAGAKSWLLFPQAEGSGVPQPVEIEMHEGSLLYIPRGVDHEAKSSTQASIHVTVGLRPLYGFELLEELGAVAREHALFQQPVPFDLGGSEAQQAFEEDFLGRLRTLLSETPAASLVDRRARAFVDLQPAGWPGRFSDMLRLGQITTDTVLCARSEIVRRMVDCGNSLEVHFAGTRTTVPKFLQACLDQALSDHPFAVGELQGMMTPAGKVGFVTPFVAVGLLSIVRI